MQLNLCEWFALVGDSGDLYSRVEMINCVNLTDVLVARWLDGWIEKIGR